MIPSHIEPKSNSDKSLTYTSSLVEGQCILLQVNPVKRSLPLFSIFVFVSIILMGFPPLIVWWYPWLKKKLYFRTCSIQQASHFHVINYDGSTTFPQKKFKVFHMTNRFENHLVYFKNRYMTYLVENGRVRALQYNFLERVKEIRQKKEIEKICYNKQIEIQNLMDTYGPGVMIINMPSIPMLFFVQVMRPLFLFILFSFALWVYEEYYYFAGIILFIAIVGIIINLYQTYQNNKRVYSMAYSQEKINVLRYGQVSEISSTGLVPGDVVFLKKQIKIPFDGVILQGEALINECALTGQSIPVLKKPQDVSSINQIKTSYIYEGTSLIQVGNTKKWKMFQFYREKYGVPVLVARTNFATMKGQLIRVIVFPKQRQNIFERQSAKFLVFLFCLAVVSYGILIHKLKQLVPTQDLVVKFLDLITITVPPSLPVSMTFGIIFGLQKMKKKKIFCSSPNKVVHGGLTDWVCFDKTGTLTQDYMGFYRLTLSQNGKFLNPLQNLTNEDEKDLGKNRSLGMALNNMAMNHTIIFVQEMKENIGDPMELKLFQFGKFYFTNQKNPNPEIIMSFNSHRNHNGSVYKRFDFDSQLFRMSSIGKSSITGENMYIYTKGSPEIMQSLFVKQSVPEDYYQKLKQYASQGYRVLAIGSKKINQGQFGAERDSLESNLIFDGFEVFENKLKPETRQAMENLIDAQLPCTMITGDNALTASNIAYSCAISDPNKNTLIISQDADKKYISIEEFNAFNIEQAKKVVYKDFKGRKVQIKDSMASVEKMLNQQPLGPQSAKPIAFQLQQKINKKQVFDIDLIIEKLASSNSQLCITGPALNRIFQTEQINDKKQMILLNTTTFARCKPNDKIKVISLYQKLGKKVSMCGDGANDCGALKQADIGLSLSLAEASISAPFTSHVTNISSMVQLLKECRAGLATNFSLFNIMAMYSLVQYTSTIITQYYYSYPGDFQYLFWDLFCNFFFFMTFGFTKTANKLSKQIPSGSLFSFSNIFEIIVSFGLQLSGQILMIVGLSQIFATEMQYSSQVTKAQYVQEQDFVRDSYESNCLFLFSNIMYIMTLLAFSISKPWRKQFYTNPLFMIVLVIILGYAIIMIPVKQARLQIFQLTHANYQMFNWYIFGMALGIGVVIYAVQKLLQKMFNKLKRKKCSSCL